MTRHFLWNEHAELLTKPLATVLMDLRREDGDNDLLMDSVTLAELTEEADRMLAIDGVVTKYNRLERVASQMELVMNRASGTVKPVAKQISDPFIQYGVLQVVVLFELSDGQTISVYFHNPDTTPKKIVATDELVSWKWLLNKKDVTILVAPERGKEVNAREVARRIMKAAEKNSAAFVRNNAKRAERLRAIEAIKTEIVELETECKDLERQIDEARFRQEEPSVPNGVIATFESRFRDTNDFKVYNRATDKTTRVRLYDDGRAEVLWPEDAGLTAEQAVAAARAKAKSDGMDIPLDGPIMSIGAESGEIEPSTPKLDRDDAIARVDAAYRFEHASDEFKEWLAESLDKPGYSPFVTAREMDKRAKANGATIEWGFFGGAALDSVYVAEGDEDWDEDWDGDWDDQEDTPDPDTAPLFDGNPNWREQPRDRRTGRWRRSRGRQLKAAAGKAGRAVAKAARQAGSYVAQALKGNGKGGHSPLHGASNALEVAAKMDPGMAAINELVGGVKAIKGVFDSAVYDSTEQDGYVGKIRKDGEIIGLVDMDDDGKAMVFVGENLDERVRTPSGLAAMYSDDDAPDMIDWLFIHLKGIAKQNEQTTESQRTAMDVARDLIWLLGDLGLQRPEQSRKKAKKIKGFALSNDYTSRDGKQVTFGSDSQSWDSRRLTVIAMKGRSETRIEITESSVAEAVYQQIADFFKGLDNAKAAEFEAGLSKDVDTSDPDVREHLELFKDGIFNFIANTNKDAYLKAVRAFLEGDMVLASSTQKNKLIRLSDLSKDSGFMPKPIDKAIKAVTKPKDILASMMVMIDPDDFDSRHPLGGVKVEDGRLVASDGHRLAILKTDTSKWSDLKEHSAGDTIVGPDGSLIDGQYRQYPEVDRVIPTRQSSDTTVEISAAKLAARCRGVLKAAKMIDKDRQEHFPITIKIGDLQEPFSAKYLLEMAETFQRFGYATFTASFHKDRMLAISPDEKLTQLVMKQRYDDIVPNYMAPLGDEILSSAPVNPKPGPKPKPKPQPTGGNEPDPRAELEAALQALIDSETDIDRYDAELDRIAGLAEAAGLMEVLDAKLNEAADKLTVLLNEEAARVA